MKFKVWDIKNQCWLTDKINKVVELNWVVTGDGAGIVTVEKVDLMSDYEIVLPNENGQFEQPETFAT